MKKLILFFITFLLYTALLDAATGSNFKNHIKNIAVEKNENMLVVIISGSFEDEFSPLVQIDADNNIDTGDNGFEYAVDSTGSLSRWNGMNWCYIEDAVNDISDSVITLSIYLDDLYDPSIGGAVNVRVKGLNANGREADTYSQHVDITDGSESMVSSAVFKMHSMDVANIEDTSVKVKWKTTRYSVGYIEYGKNTYYGKTTEEESSYGKNHLIALSGLSPDTLYHYRIISEADDGRVIISDDMTFKTRCKIRLVAESSLLGRVAINIEDNLLTMDIHGVFQNGFLPIIRIDADRDSNTGNVGSEYIIDDNGAVFRWSGEKWIYVSDVSIEIQDDKISIVALMGDFNAPSFAATIVFTVGGKDISGKWIETIVKSITWRENSYLDEQANSNLPTGQDDYSALEDDAERVDAGLSSEAYLWRELGDIYASNSQEEIESTLQYQEETEELMAAARRGVRLYESYYSGGFRIVDNGHFETLNREALHGNSSRIGHNARVDVLAYDSHFNLLQNAYQFHYKKEYNLSNHMHKSKVYIADYSRGLKIIDIRDKYKSSSSYGVDVAIKSIPDIITLMNEAQVYISDYSQGLRLADSATTTAKERYQYTSSAYGLLEEMKRFSHAYNDEINTVDINSPIALARMMKRIDDNNEIKEVIRDDDKVYAVDYSRGLRLLEMQKKRTIYASNTIFNFTRNSYRHKNKEYFPLKKYSFNIV